MLTASSLEALFNKQKKLPESLQVRFLKQMQRFLVNGYSLQDTLEATAWDKDLAETSSYFLKRLQYGDRLDLIFEKAGFHHSVSAFLHFAYVHSDLADAIGKCAEIMEQRFNNYKKFKLIIRYPLLLLMIFFLLLIFINHHVLPAFQSLLTTSPQALHTVTILKWIMDSLQFLFVLFSILFIIIAFTWNYSKKNMSIEEQLRILNRIPIYRRYLRAQTSFQFATHFISLLKAGLSLKEILCELSNQQRLPIISHYAKLLTNHLKSGIHISYLMKELPFIERQLAIIFQKNATINVLEKDLSLYSDLLLDEMQRMIIRMITIIQPIFYITLGTFIIFIYISLMWPMFQMMNTF